MAYSLTWDLDSIFPGGSSSPQFQRHLEELERRLQELAEELRSLPVPAGPPEWEAWYRTLERLQDVYRGLKEAGSFVGCLTAQDVRDERARALQGRVAQMGATLASALVELDRRLLQVPEEAWRAMLADPRFAPVAFALEERRVRAAEKLPPEQEALAAELAVDGYHAWGELYQLVAGRIAIPVEEDGRRVELSVGQAENRLRSPDRRFRAEVFARWEEAWGRHAELCAAALNHLSGFRLHLYRRRGWHDVLKEPLDINRLTRPVLEAMWDAVERAKPRLVAYLQRKARWLGIERLSWHDVEAPVGRSARRIPYDEGAEFIIRQFHRFGPELGDFARRAFQERWIEAEDRPGKRHGGFCTSFPIKGESRIFLTYSGIPENVVTVAHELGHAFHFHALRDLPPLVQRYPMCLAETASTFAELIVSEAAIQHAADREERLALLEDRAQRAVTFLMNIHARFLFELSFYEARRRGPLTVAELNRLMEEAQRKAFCHALGEYHPLFWASKLHFYLTGTPFYNFPYTFGYLFSHGLFARAREEGPRFLPRYVALLRDTGRMTVAQLAKRHLGADLARPSFWEEAVAAALEPVERLLEEMPEGGPKPEA